MGGGYCNERWPIISERLEYNSLQGGKSINNILKGIIEMLYERVSLKSNYLGNAYI